MARRHELCTLIGLPLYVFLQCAEQVVVHIAFECVAMFDEMALRMCHLGGINYTPSNRIPCLGYTRKQTWNPVVEMRGSNKRSRFREHVPLVGLAFRFRGRRGAAGEDLRSARPLGVPGARGGVGAGAGSPGHRQGAWEGAICGFRDSATTTYTFLVFQNNHGALDKDCKIPSFSRLLQWLEPR